MMRKQTESIGITLKVSQVMPLRRRQTIARLRTNIVLQKQTITLAEISANSILATVTKRRITQIMSKASSTHNTAKFREMRIIKFGTMTQNEPTDVVTQTATHTAHLKTVRQTIVNKDASRQRKHLSLVLQTAERRRKDKAIVVTLKFSTVVIALLNVLLTKPLAGKQRFPLHHLTCHSTLNLCP